MLAYWKVNRIKEKEDTAISLSYTFISKKHMFVFIMLEELVAHRRQLHRDGHY